MQLGANPGQDLAEDGGGTRTRKRLCEDSHGRARDLADHLPARLDEVAEGVISLIWSAHERKCGVDPGAIKRECLSWVTS